MTNEELVKVILDKVGGRDNVLAATNCMTRLRIDVKDDAKIDEEGLKGAEGVMGVVHDKVGYVEVVVGPGKCRKCADICASMGIPAAAGVQASEGMSVQNDWKANKEAVKAGQKQSKVKAMLKTFGEIFYSAASRRNRRWTLLRSCHSAYTGGSGLCGKLPYGI